MNYVPQWGAFFADATGFDQQLDPDFGFSPHIHLNINMTTSTKDVLSEDNKIEIFPNPSSDLITLNLDFVETFEKINVEITDVTGKTLLQTDYQNVLNEQFQFNVNNYPAGTYFLHVRTEEGNRALRFVVAK